MAGEIDQPFPFMDLRTSGTGDLFSLSLVSIWLSRSLFLSHTHSLTLVSPSLTLSLSSRSSLTLSLSPLFSLTYFLCPSLAGGIFYKEVDMVNSPSGFDFSAVNMNQIMPQLMDVMDELMPQVRVYEWINANACQTVTQNNEDPTSNFF